uniref:Ubiquitin-like domain-containing protein n=1 Tax=Trypanosoma vivax (strain Y486) TaxID=1055687 RepID=G0TRB4_TRYVY|nr:conserved hypothetical protein [Trypanosoma vivax Y486]
MKSINDQGAMASLKEQSDGERMKENFPSTQLKAHTSKRRSSTDLVLLRVIACGLEYALPADTKSTVGTILRAVVALAFPNSAHEDRYALFINNKMLRENKRVGEISPDAILHLHHVAEGGGQKPLARSTGHASPPVLTPSSTSAVTSLFRHPASPSMVQDPVGVPSSLSTISPTYAVLQTSYTDPMRGQSLPPNSALTKDVSEHREDPSQPACTPTALCGSNRQVSAPRHIPVPSTSDERASAKRSLIKITVILRGQDVHGGVEAERRASGSIEEASTGGSLPSLGLSSNSLSSISHWNDINFGDGATVFRRLRVDPQFPVGTLRGFFNIQLTQSIYVGDTVIRDERTRFGDLGVALLQPFSFRPAPESRTGLSLSPTSLNVPRASSGPTKLSGKLSAWSGDGDKCESSSITSLDRRRSHHLLSGLEVRRKDDDWGTRSKASSKVVTGIPLQTRSSVNADTSSLPKFSTCKERLPPVLAPITDHASNVDTITGSSSSNNNNNGDGRDANDRAGDVASAIVSSIVSTASPACSCTLSSLTRTLTCHTSDGFSSKAATTFCQADASSPNNDAHAEVKDENLEDLMLLYPIPRELADASLAVGPLGGVGGNHCHSPPAGHEGDTPPHLIVRPASVMDMRPVPAQTEDDTKAAKPSASSGHECTVQPVSILCSSHRQLKRNCVSGSFNGLSSVEQPLVHHQRYQSQRCLSVPTNSTLGTGSSRAPLGTAHTQGPRSDGVIYITVKDPRDPSRVYRNIPVKPHCPVTMLRHWFLQNGDEHRSWSLHCNRVRVDGARPLSFYQSTGGKNNCVFELWPHSGGPSTPSSSDSAKSVASPPIHTDPASHEVSKNPSA